MSVTIKDVAREAKVATSTVSRVLSGKGRISESTKERVSEAIKKLNYTPNVIARGLAKSRTRILAVVLPEGADKFFSNPFYTQAMKGISLCSQEENYFIMYAFIDSNDEGWLKKFTESNLVDGLILFNAKENDDNIKYLKEIKFPFVIIGHSNDLEDILWVDNDNFSAMYNLTRKLIELNHDNIAFVGAQRDLKFTNERLKGYIEGLISKNREVDYSLIYECNDFTEMEGRKIAEKMLEDNIIPSAILATDDLLAFGVQNYFYSKNIFDISIVGFNNTLLAQYQEIPLSSVDINSEKLGYYASKVLIDNLEMRENRKQYYIIETELIERESINYNKK